MKGERVLCSHGHRNDVRSFSEQETGLTSCIQLNVVENGVLQQHEQSSNISLRQDDVLRHFGNLIPQSTDARFANRRT
jgi:hypothetical protein